MTPEQFAYWLQGFVEMNGGKEPTKAQWKMIKDHLQWCFKKMTPPLMPYAKGVGTGGEGSGVLGAGVLHCTPNGYVHIVAGGGGGRDADKFAQYCAGGGGRPQGGGGGG
jgi:hypothetical protein